MNNIFEKYPNIEIVGDNLIENKISQRILLKLGFKFEKKVINNKGAIINIFKLNKENFLNRKNNNLDIEKEFMYEKRAYQSYKHRMLSVSKHY